MGLFTNLIFSFIHLVLITGDILFFFILVRMLTYKFQLRFLKASDTVGTPMVDWFIGCLREGIGWISHKTLSQRTLLVIGMLTLIFIRLALVVLFNKLSTI